MMKNLNIRTKFIILGVVGFLALTTLVFLALDVSKSWLKSLENVFHDSQNVQMIQRDYLSPIFLLRELSLSLVISPNKDFQKDIISNINPLLEDLNEKFTNLDDDVQKEWKTYIRFLYKTRQFVNRGFEEGAFINANKDEREQFYILVKKLEKLQTKELIRSSKTFINAKASVDSYRFIIYIVYIVLGLLCFFIGWLIIKKIVNSIDQLKEGLGRFFNFLKNKEINDTQGIILDSNDELGQMAQSLNIEINNAKSALKNDLELIESATNMVEEIKNGNLDTRLTISASSKELNSLKSMINEMVNDLENKIQQEISQRTDQEKLLIQQSKLASMGNMIGNIAHQWRQPLGALNAILMNMEAKVKFNDINEEYMNLKVKECDRITRHMSNTISDFQNFFKPSKIKENFYVVKACEKAGDILKASLKNNNISFTCKYAQEHEIYGYPNEFSQAFLNILSNAKDVLIQRNIENAYIDVNIKEGKSFILIKIEDNGGGIKKEYIDRIFEPYFTTKHAKQGTGIGLYMSKMIIEDNMDGVLTVYNTDEGACFTIKLSKILQ